MQGTHIGPGVGPFPQTSFSLSLEQLSNRFDDIVEHGRTLNFLPFILTVQCRSRRLRSASTIVADDPVFGRFCFGGEMRVEKDSLQIIPRDGVRKRLHLRTGGQQIDFELSGARFAKEQPIQWFIDRQRFTLTLETEASAGPEVQLSIAGLPAHSYKIICGQETQEFHPNETKPLRLRIPAGSSTAGVEIIRI